MKFFSAAGAKLPDDVEATIEQGLEAPLTCVPSAALGKAYRVEDASGRYVEFCKSTFPNELDLKGWRIVVDCAHGAAYHVAPPVFHELGADVIAVGSEPDGLNINAGCGATHPQFLAGKVREHEADIGIALDGDGDRLIMCDREGRIYDGDELLYVIAADYHRRSIAHGGIVGTQMTNLGIEHAFERAGMMLTRTRVGDRYILEEMNARRWLLGGENSGHIICLDKHTTGDGIIAALAVLRSIIEQKQTLAQAMAGVSMFPQKLINVPIRRGFDWKASDSVVQAERDAVRALEGTGRVLLRPSGTEPVLRVMVEARDGAAADTHARHIAEIIARAAGSPL